MAEAALAQKFVDSALLNTWDKGPPLAALLVQKLVGKGGDSVDVGSDDTGPTIHEDTETADPESRSFARTQLIVNERVFLNSDISPTQMAQLLAGNYAPELVRADSGAFRNKIDDKVVNGLLRGLAATAHANLAVAAGSRPMITRMEAKMLSQPGVSEQDILWILSPAAGASMGDLFPDVQPAQIGDSVDMGKIKGRSVNGIPAIRHQGIPGYNRRRQGISASSITGGNTLNLTMASANHGFVVGQRVRTQGLQVDAQDAVPAGPTIATVAGAAITIVDNAFSDDADNEPAPGAYLESDSAMAILICRSRCWYGTDQQIPLSSITKRTDAAGFSHQLFQHIGTKCFGGSVRALHFSLVEAED